MTAGEVRDRANAILTAAGYNPLEVGGVLWSTACEQARHQLAAEQVEAEAVENYRKGDEADLADEVRGWDEAGEVDRD